MEPVSVIQRDGRTLAIFVRKGAPCDGPSHFFTRHEDAFQMGVFERPAGYRVLPHQHTGITVRAERAPEFLFFESGRARVTVFDDAWEICAEETLGAGDMFLSLGGGHSIEMLESTRFIEVKQGPYPGDQKAKIFRDGL